MQKLLFLAFPTGKFESETLKKWLALEYNYYPIFKRILSLDPILNSLYFSMSKVKRMWALEVLKSIKSFVKNI